MDRYLTTRELADLLRIKERKVYDLAANGTVPHTKATGKLLFAREAIESWLKERSDGPAGGVSAIRPPVLLGSHDPLLEWAVRESGCGLATMFDGSGDGLERFARGEGVMAGLHIHDPQDGGWNVAAVRARFRSSPAVLVEWAKRSRGLLVSRVPGATVSGIVDLKGKRIATRQPGSGSQAYFSWLMERHGLAAGDIVEVGPSRTETDAAVTVLEAKADAAFSIQALAAQYGLGFIPVTVERFDLLIDRKAYFDKPVQTLMAFVRTSAFTARVAELEGYDVSGLATVHFNGA